MGRDGEVVWEIVGGGGNGGGMGWERMVVEGGWWEEGGMWGFVRPANSSIAKWSIQRASKFIQVYFPIYVYFFSCNQKKSRSTVM